MIKVNELTRESIISYTCYMLDVSDSTRDDEFWNSVPRTDRNKLQRALQAFFDVNNKYVKQRKKQ